ncbi:MAG: short-chain dehydrogenase [Methylobacterium sp.]|nr:MAG: short-chain dehydrogenase [Methylobacterium sp.]
MRMPSRPSCEADMEEPRPDIMNNSLRKIAIIAGAGPGMGFAIARRFAREGYDIGLIARDQGRLDAFAAELSHLDIRTCAASADLCDLDALKAAFDTIPMTLGNASVLVYNGARWHEQKAMEIDPMTFNWDIALCCTGALASAQHVYPAMKEARKGSILFTGGGLALYPEYGANVSSLTAGKSALRGLTYAMAKELAPEGIHVATVTIAGQVSENTAFTPEAIAERYWLLHQQEPGAWTVESVFEGK